VTCCDWCENKLGDEFIQIEGFIFCNEECEGKYYQDRIERKRIGKMPIFLERNLKVKNCKTATNPHN